jgi:hypothetical protein
MEDPHDSWVQKAESKCSKAVHGCYDQLKLVRSWRGQKRRQSSTRPLYLCHQRSIQLSTEMGLHNS